MQVAHGGLQIAYLCLRYNMKAIVRIIIPILALCCSMTHAQAQGRVSGVGGAASPTVPTAVATAPKRIVVDENISDFQREMLENQFSARPLNQQSVHNQRIDMRPVDTKQPFSRSSLIPPVPSHHVPAQRPLSNQGASPAPINSGNVQERRPEFPRDQRATPTKKGSKTKPRHRH